MVICADFENDWKIRLCVEIEQNCVRFELMGEVHVDLLSCLRLFMNVLYPNNNYLISPRIPWHIPCEYVIIFQYQEEFASMLIPMYQKQIGFDLMLLATILNRPGHYCDVIMGAMASQITSLTIVCSTVYSGADKKHRSSASLAFVKGIHR